MEGQYAYEPVERTLKIQEGLDSFKIDDTANQVTLLAFDNQVPRIFSSSEKLWLSIKQDVTFIKKIPVTQQANSDLAVFNSKDMADMPTGVYQAELWVQNDQGTALYPSDGFLTLTIKENTAMLSGNISTITLQQLEDTLTAKLEDIAHNKAIKGDKGADGEVDVNKSYDFTKQQFINGKQIVTKDDLDDLARKPELTKINDQIKGLAPDDSVIHRIGDQTITSDKAGFAIFKNGINQSIDGGINWGTLAIAKTPSLYGAVGDGRDDGAGLQRAIDDNYGKTLAIDRDYSTNQQLKIKDTINLVFTTGSIKATKEMDSLIAVTAGTVCFASNGISQKDYINLNNIAHAGIVQTGGETRLNQIKVGKLPAGAVGIDVSNHANITAINVVISNRFNGKQDQIPTETIGIRLTMCWDNYLSNIQTVEIQTGMVFNGSGNNFVDYFHPWSVAPTITGKTIGIAFGRAATDYNYFSHIYLDTCAKGMTFLSDTNAYISGLFNYFNSDYYNSNSGYPEPVLFYYEGSDSTGKGIHLIHGNLTSVPRGMNVKFSNLESGSFSLIDTQISNYTNVPPISDEINSFAGGNLNDLTADGHFMYYGRVGGSFTNLPSGEGSGFFLETYTKRNDNSGFQRFSSPGNGKTYYRAFHNGTQYNGKYFYPWKEV